MEIGMHGFSEARFIVVANGLFYLWTGGFALGNAKINDIFSLLIRKMSDEAVEFVTPSVK